MTNSTAIKGNLNTKNVKPVKSNRYTVNTSSLTPSVTKIVDGTDTVLITPTVYFTPEVYKQMQFIVDHCKQEVGWMGLVNDMGNNVYVIDKIYIPEQTVSSTETDISSEAMANLALEIMNDNEDPSRMYAWFHSHVNMAVSPSAQDENQVAEFVENCPIFIRGIMNKKENLKVDVYYRDYNTAYNCVKTNIWTDPISKEQTTKLTEIIKQNVKQKVYSYSKYTTGFNNKSKTSVPKITNVPNNYSYPGYEDYLYDDDLEEYEATDKDSVDYHFSATEWDHRIGFSCTKYEKEILDQLTDQEIIIEMEQNPWFPFDENGNFIADELFEFED